MQTMPDLTVYRYDFEVPKSLSDFNPKVFVDGALEWVAGLVEPNEKVALSESGGVDSTTVAFLLKEALGERLHLFFINDGFRRILGDKEEFSVTASMFEDFPNFEVLHNREIVVPWFEGISDGTMKRDIFRSLYTVASNKHIASLSADWIADGTIAPDIVMTDEKRQTQHNVDLPYTMRKLEPLAPLYKPHVRKVATYLGIPKDFARKIPCPGPAQLLRVGGAFNEEKLHICKHATDIVETKVREYCRDMWGQSCKYDENTGVRTPFQYFSACLDPEMEPDTELATFVTGIVGQDVQCWKMKTEAMWIDPTVTEQARKLYAPVVWVKGPKVDYEIWMKITDAVFEKFGLPRVLYEVFDSGTGTYPVTIKIVESEDVRTAWPMRVDFDYLVETGKAICEKSGAARVAFDISRRPPATIELF